jgi:hypothetical protein
VAPQQQRLPRIGPGGIDPLRTLSSRIMEVLTRYGIRASAAINSEVSDHHPEIIEEGGRHGWALIGHNQTNALRLTEMDGAEERKVISRCPPKIGFETDSPLEGTGFEPSVPLRGMARTRAFSRLLQCPRF